MTFRFPDWSFQVAFMLSIDTSWIDSGDSDRAIAWTREFWDEMRPGTRGSIYLNFLSDDEDNEAMLRAAYGDGNYERLVDVKTKYDRSHHPREH